MVKPTSKEGQKANQHMEKLERENDDLRKRLEQVERLMRQSLAMNGGSAAPATSNEPSRREQTNSQSRSGASGELETQQRDDDEQIQNTTAMADITEQNNLAVTLWSARANRQQEQTERANPGRESSRMDESGTPKVATAQRSAATCNTCDAGAGAQREHASTANGPNKWPSSTNSKEAS